MLQSNSRRLVEIEILQTLDAAKVNETLLRGIKGFNVLDIRDTQVTDAGLKIIADVLPNLEVLYTYSPAFSDRATRLCSATARRSQPPRRDR